MIINLEKGASETSESEEFDQNEFENMKKIIKENKLTLSPKNYLDLSDSFDDKMNIVYDCDFDTQEIILKLKSIFQKKLKPKKLKFKIDDEIFIYNILTKDKKCQNWLFLLDKQDILEIKELFGYHKIFKFMFNLDYKFTLRKILKEKNKITPKKQKKNIKTNNLKVEKLETKVSEANRNIDKLSKFLFNEKPNFKMSDFSIFIVEKNFSLNPDFSNLKDFIIFNLQNHCNLKEINIQLKKVIKSQNKNINLDDKSLRDLIYLFSTKNLLNNLKEKIGIGHSLPLVINHDNKKKLLIHPEIEGYGIFIAEIGNLKTDKEKISNIIFKTKFNESFSRSSHHSDIDINYDYNFFDPREIIFVNYYGELESKNISNVQNLLKMIDITILFINQKFFKTNIKQIQEYISKLKKNFKGQVVIIKVEYDYDEEEEDNNNIEKSKFQNAHLFNFNFEEIDDEYHSEIRDVIYSSKNLKSKKFKVDNFINYFENDISTEEKNTFKKSKEFLNLIKKKISENKLENELSFSKYSKKIYDIENEIKSFDCPISRIDSEFLENEIENIKKNYKNETISEVLKIFIEILCRKDSQEILFLLKFHFEKLQFNKNFSIYNELFRNLLMKLEYDYFENKHFASRKIIISKLSNLIKNGLIIEFLDGEYFESPYLTLKEIFNKQNLSSFKSICCVGSQSSGKSTLLNFLFGSRFGVSQGKCTSGINIKLIKLKKENKIQNLIVFDTEGLHSPEKSNPLFDKKILTLLISFVNYVMVVVRGELDQILINDLQNSFKMTQKNNFFQNKPSTEFIFNQNNKTSDIAPFEEQLYNLTSIEKKNINLLGFAFEIKEVKLDGEKVKQNYFVKASFLKSIRNLSMQILQNIFKDNSKKFSFNKFQQNFNIIKHNNQIFLKFKNNYNFTSEFIEKFKQSELKPLIEKLTQKIEKTQKKIEEKIKSKNFELKEVLNSLDLKTDKILEDKCLILLKNSNLNIDFVMKNIFMKELKLIFNTNKSIKIFFLTQENNKICLENREIHEFKKNFEKKMTEFLVKNITNDSKENIQKQLSHMLDEDLEVLFTNYSINYEEENFRELLLSLLTFFNQKKNLFGEFFNTKIEIKKIFVEEKQKLKSEHLSKKYYNFDESLDDLFFNIRFFKSKFENKILDLAKNFQKNKCLIKQYFQNLIKIVESPILNLDDVIDFIEHFIKDKRKIGFKIKSILNSITFKKMGKKGIQENSQFFEEFFFFNNNRKQEIKEYILFKKNLHEKFINQNLTKEEIYKFEAQIFKYFFERKDLMKNILPEIKKMSNQFSQFISKKSLDPEKIENLLSSISDLAEQNTNTLNNKLQNLTLTSFYVSHVENFLIKEFCTHVTYILNHQIKRYLKNIKYDLKNNLESEILVNCEKNEFRLINYLNQIIFTNSDSLLNKFFLQSISIMKNKLTVKVEKILKKNFDKEQIIRKIDKIIFSEKWNKFSKETYIEKVLNLYKIEKNKFEKKTKGLINEIRDEQKDGFEFRLQNSISILEFIEKEFDLDESLYKIFGENIFKLNKLMIFQFISLQDDFFLTNYCSENKNSKKSSSLIKLKQNISSKLLDELGIKFQANGNIDDNLVNIFNYVNKSTNSKINSLVEFLKILKGRLYELKNQLDSEYDIFLKNSDYLNLQKMISENAEEIYGCDEFCPLCLRKCEKKLKSNVEHVHDCSITGHQMTIFTDNYITVWGKKFDSILSCNEIDSSVQLYVEEEKRMLNFSKILERLQNYSWFIQFQEIENQELKTQQKKFFEHLTQKRLNSELNIDYKNKSVFFSIEPIGRVEKNDLNIFMNSLSVAINTYLEYDLYFNKYMSFNTLCNDHQVDYQIMNIFKIDKLSNDFFNEIYMNDIIKSLIKKSRSNKFDCVVSILFGNDIFKEVESHLEELKNAMSSPNNIYFFFFVSYKTKVTQKEEFNNFFEMCYEHFPKTNFSIIQKIQQKTFFSNYSLNIKSFEDILD